VRPEPVVVGGVEGHRHDRELDLGAVRWHGVGPYLPTFAR
jgi:hypothetical protein